MRADTKLNKIMALPDTDIKKSKLFVFCCTVLPHCQLWETASNEIKRLTEAGVKYPLQK